jgi:predicted nucleotidyltransferase
MSGNFVQRGDVAIMDKFERARIAVQNGVDLVIELPVPYVLSSAEGFSRAAMYIFNSLGCVDELSFGSECGDLEKLIEAAHATIKVADTPELKYMLDNGASFPAAVQELVEQNLSVGELAILTLDVHILEHETTIMQERTQQRLDNFVGHLAAGSLNLRTNQREIEAKLLDPHLGHFDHIDAVYIHNTVPDVNTIVK